MGQEGHIIDQKGLKMHEKAKNRVFGPKKLFFSGIWGYPPPPLTENHLAQKPLVEMGGIPPPLTEKIRSVVFDSFPNTRHHSFGNTVQPN